MKNLFIFLMLVLTGTLIQAAKPTVLTPSSSVFAPNKRGFLNLGTAEQWVKRAEALATQEEELKQRIEEEWDEINEDDIADWMRFSDENIRELMNSNDTTFLNKSVEIYGQKFLVRELLQELLNPVSKLTSDVANKILANEMVQNALEQSQGMWSVASMRARLAMLNVLEAIANSTSSAAKNLKVKIDEEIA